MDSCSKGPKRFSGFELCSSRDQHKTSQIETDRADAKRQRRALDSTGDDFEEFVALLDRIRYMKTNHLNFCFSEEISMREDSDVKLMKTKSPWMPSFEWVDFPGFSAKDPMFAVQSPTKNDPASRYEEKGKQSIQPANGHFSMRFSSVDKRPAECFDLNVEASLDHTIPVGI